jgi:hypothetical protein
LSFKIESFAQISPKHALNRFFFFNIQKRPKHFQSGVLFQKRPNCNHDLYPRTLQAIKQTAIIIIKGKIGLTRARVRVRQYVHV